MSSQLLTKQNNESNEEFIKRVYSLKAGMYLGDYTWEDLAIILNEQTGYNYTESKYRKDFKRLENNPSVEFTVDDETAEKILELKKQRVKLNDERTQLNSLVRTLAREETLKEVAREAVLSMENNGRFLPKSSAKVTPSKKKSGLLAIGDWHYGLDVDLYVNKFNPDIAIERVNKLKNKVIELCKKEGINSLSVVNLGDMISGNIHLPLRLNSRKDVASQTMEVTEIICEFLADIISEGIFIDYYTVNDNHSRFDPNKKDALQTESFVRITKWYIQERFREEKNIVIHDNELGDDMASFDICGHHIIAVHGDKDPQRNIIPNLTSFTKTHYDLILSAHMHHFSADERNETEFYCNGSLIGTDDYANGLRLNSKPSQTLFVCTPEDVTECIYKIKLD